VLEFNSQAGLLTQPKLLSQQIEALIQQMSRLPQQIRVMQVALVSSQPVLRCDFCRGNY